MTSNYFSHDSNARNSEELLRIRMELGLSGYAVYFMLLERLREENSYMSIKDYNVIAFDLHCDASLIKKVVENFGLFVFTEDGKYFYSESFNRRMDMKDAKSQKRSEAGKKAVNKRWEKKKSKEKDTNVLPTYNERNTNAVRNDTKESKGKKREVKENKEPKKNHNQAKEVIAYLNQKAGKNFKNVDGNYNIIEPRLKDYSVDELKKVIDNKVADWINSSKYKNYLRPETLFRASKIDGYLNEMPKQATVKQGGDNIGDLGF